MIISNCFFNSSGVSDLLALYSVYNSFLNVGPFGSKTKAKWVGFRFLSSLNVVLKKPYMALTSIPLLFIIGFGIPNHDLNIK